MRRKFKLTKRLHSFKNQNNPNTHQNPSNQSLTNQHNISNVYNINKPQFDIRDHDIDQFLLSHINTNNPIKISTINIAGNFSSKIKNIMGYMWDHNIEILILTETHHKDNIYQDTIHKIQYQTTMGNKLYYIQHNSKAKIFDGITLIISQKIYHSYFVQS